MILRAAYVRFYRAFNYDYLRKRHPGYKPDPWDKMDDGSFYPYICLKVDPEFTAVVGANESGKSQLLQAIECALGKTKPTPADFCRYSAYFTVAETMRTPHFGLHFEEVTEEEARKLSGFFGFEGTENISSFHIFRTSLNQLELYINGQKHEVADSEVLSDLLPSVFRIDSNRALPNSVPIWFLISGGDRGGGELGLTRTDRMNIISPIIENASQILPTLQNSEDLATTIQNIVQGVPASKGLSGSEAESQLSQMKLAYDLLLTVGGIDVSAFDELQKALRNDAQGLANGIMAAMNDQLEKSVNLAKWWSQDQLFRLAITARDFDIVFTIRDRTGSEYSFAERSSGLKYFLSYLVQFLAHVNERDRPEILLMDEPDTYLSNQGQQDLLRIFHEFTVPTESGPGGQVLYVTHSPFLIDKNRADRIRVLDKGAGEEGVRVVRDVGRNHFEPLRTALGSFVGETTFIGNCNLMVEGIADQIYLARMSDILYRKGFAITERLDLNRITLVPVGAASNMPYMTYLARGRDFDKPAVIVLLDGDDEGDEAVKVLKRGGPRRKQVIRTDYVTQLKPKSIPDISSDRPKGPLDIEDLIPVEIGLSAAKEYHREMAIREPEEFPSVEAITNLLSESKGVLKAIQEGLEIAGSELHLEKIGFARHAVSVCEESESESAKKMRERFAALFSHLTKKQREAERERDQESVAARVDREKALFLRDRRAKATKADVAVLLERIESVVDQSIEGDALLTSIRRIRENFNLDRDLNDEIDDYTALRGQIETLKYAEVLSSQPEAQGQSSNGLALGTLAPNE